MEEKKREQGRLLREIQDQLDREDHSKGDNQPRKSKWLDTINKEKLEKDKR